jgi:L-histidine N-alpha-methyltransferase
MNRPQIQQHADERLRIFNLPQDSLRATLANDVRTGLSARPKRLPPKYFYDEHGSQLFDDICATPEYYPTRTERRLLEIHAEEIVRLCRPATIIEFGSGTAAKTEHLLELAASDARIDFVPIDVSEQTLATAAERLLADYRNLSIDAWVGDYDAGLEHMHRYPGPRLFLFLGGSIGNFEEAEAVAFLSRIAASMGPGDYFLLGADRVKDETVLNAAYNDAKGVTARFNLNVLRVINRELDGEFDLNHFNHDAFFNHELDRIEMHLRANRPHNVAIRALDMEIEFDRGETIMTEISRKFTGDSLRQTFKAAGLALENFYQPDNEYFALALARRI